MLFHSPKGKGGGHHQIRRRGGGGFGDNLIVSATADGGIKVALLEGKGSGDIAQRKIYHTQGRTDGVCVAGRKNFRAAAGYQPR
ncbi:MAG: hypothetical protein WDM80_00195 [Limisphaerales bacterium]